MKKGNIAMALEQGESLLLQRTERQSEGSSTEKRVIGEEAGKVGKSHTSAKYFSF